jgi:hypothetical protein
MKLHNWSFGVLKTVAFEVPRHLLRRRQERYSTKATYITNSTSPPPPPPSIRTSPLGLDESTTTPVSSPNLEKNNNSLLTLTLAHHSNTASPITPTATYFTDSIAPAAPPYLLTVPEASASHSRNAIPPGTTTVTGLRTQKHSHHLKMCQQLQQHRL